MPTLVSRRRRSNEPVSESPSVSARDTIEISPVLDALCGETPEVPAVLVRLLLMAADEATGEERLVASLLKKISMPLDLAGPGVKIALELNGERRVFEPAHIVWEESRRVCILEVVWSVPDDARTLDRVKPEKLPPAGSKRVRRVRNPARRATVSLPSARSRS
jgi:hypothetical protein